jgi:Domain of unknown function (DUF4440)
MSGDTSLLEPIYADDYVLVRPNGDTLGKREILDDLRRHSMRFTSFEVNDVLIRIRGMVGILTADVRSTAMRVGVEVKTHARQLATVSKEKGRLRFSIFNQRASRIRSDRLPSPPCLRHFIPQAFLFPSISIFGECKGIVVDEAACSGESSHFANLLAVKPRLKFEPLSSQHAGFCPSFRYLRYTRDIGPAAGGCGVSISI